jgi:CheY-like chemotaxis protein
MPARGSKVVILMAEDDEDDRLLIREAFADSLLDHDLRFVEDGQQMIDYLLRKGKYALAGVDAPRPDLILLDLNMPVKDGRVVLREIKQEPELKGIPIVVLTESSSDEDCKYCYAMGVESFLTKSLWLVDLIEAIKANAEYWLNMMTGKKHGE